MIEMLLAFVLQETPDEYFAIRNVKAITVTQGVLEGVTILLKNGCMHPSWYGKTFTVPPEWSGKEVWLHIGGVKPAAGLWVNGHKLGETTTSRSPGSGYRRGNMRAEVRR